MKEEWILMDNLFKGGDKGAVFKLPGIDPGFPCFL